jgi:uncharacterized protein (TIGR02266 family)
MSGRAARKSRGKHKAAEAAIELLKEVGPTEPSSKDVGPESAARSTMRPVAPRLDSVEEATVRVVGAVLDRILAPLAPKEPAAAAEEEVPPTLDEHRVHPRVAFEVEIDLHSESHFFSGLSGDVSEGGLFVQTYRPLKVGDHVQVAFDLPDGRVEADAVVRWRRAHGDAQGAGVGIEFESLSEKDRTVIHKFCEGRAPLYYEV